MNNFFQKYVEYIASVKKFSKHSSASYAADLRIFEQWLDDMELMPFSLSVSQMRVFIAELADKKFSPASINRILSTLRGFYKYAVMFKLTSENPMLSFKNFKAAQKLPNFLFDEDVKKFCSLPSNKKLLWEARDVALFTVLYSSGCRVSEIAGLNMEDLSSDFSSAVVMGKGKKERQVFFADFAVEALSKYIPERALLLKKIGLQSEKQDKTVASLFLSKRGRSLSVRGIQYIVARYSCISTIPKTLSPHAFRHSFASTLVTRGADIRVVQELLGHESISTTQRYTHITEGRLRQLYIKSHPHA